MKKKLKIAIVSRFGVPLKKTSEGYYCRLYYLINGLVERGYEVTVLAHPASKIKAKLIGASVKKIEWETQLITFANFLKKYGNQFDIINAQTDHICCFFAPFIKTPIVHTMIFGQFWEQVKETLKIVKDQYFITNSQATKNQYPYLNWQGVVYNGLEVNQFQFNNKPKNYLLYLSRINHAKGIEIAIKAVKQTRDKLIITGQADDKNYFKKIIKPQLNKNITYFGIANFKQKVNLLKNAKALLHPHLYPESCSNTMIEAQACGTPVIAYPYGSTAEVIQNKKTGLIVEDVNGIKEAIKNISHIDRLDCRLFVAKKFTVEKMVDGYERIYQKICVKR